MTTILIVEDNQEEGFYYLQAIKKARLLEGAVAVFLVGSGEEAMQWLKKEDFYVDIFLLDVELPGINGFHLAEKIREKSCYAFAFIVFLTGYAKNPLGAFKEYHCYDYLIKPITSDVLMEKMGILIDGISEKAKEGMVRKKMVSVFSGEIYYFIVYDEIVFAEAIRNGCKVYKRSENGSEEEIQLKGVSLKGFVDEVNDAAFLQCHKSFAVNVNRISSVKKVNYRLWEIRLKDCNKTIDIGWKYMKQLKDCLGLIVERAVN